MTRYLRHQAANLVHHLMWRHQTYNGLHGDMMLCVHRFAPWAKHSLHMVPNNPNLPTVAIESDAEFLASAYMLISERQDSFDIDSPEAFLHLSEEILGVNGQRRPPVPWTRRDRAKYVTHNILTMIIIAIMSGSIAQLIFGNTDHRNNPWYWTYMLLQGFPFWAAYLYLSKHYSWIISASLSRRSPTSSKPRI